MRGAGHMMHRRSSNGYTDDQLRRSTSSHSVGGGGDGRQRRGLRRGSQQQGDGIGSSFQSSARSEQSLRDADSFGSFNSKDHQLHSFKTHHRIGIGGRSEHGACLRQSTSGCGSASVSSHMRRRMGVMSRNIKVGGRASNDKNYRRSTSMIDYHHCLYIMINFASRS